MNIFIFTIALTSVCLNALAQIFLKKTMLTINAIPTNFLGFFNFSLSLALNYWFVSALLCYVLSIGLWMAVLAKVEVSLAYPLLSIGYIITACIGYFFLKENVNFIRIIGLAFICTGIVFVSKSV
ncbi:SMR family transporter [Candidatus Arsenophonus nilaparvatae]|uniref:SMR family transporter n=1 Tax=Arsenophonus TaxID=637 RepID=UPI000509DC96|nr:SMR family transporter [Candidatus Arsenophonus nilaparvatae]